MSDAIFQHPNWFRAGLRLACLLLLLACGGCQASWMAREPWAASTFNAGPPAGTLALDGQPLVGLPGNPNNSTDQLPWYAYRRDVSTPVAYDGVKSSVNELSVTYTSDHQTQSNGRVYDYSRTSTYRVQVGQTSR